MKDDFLTFADENPTLPEDKTPPWKILIADDDPSVHMVTRLALGNFTFQGRDLTLISAYGEEEVRKIMRETSDIALILLDVVMESSDSGFDLVKFIRNDLKNKNVRIIMRTGQAGTAPEDRVIIEYDINDFKDKTELTVAKLRTTLVSSLRAYSHLQLIEEEQNKLKLNKIYLKTVLDNIPTVLITFDLSFQITSWNQSAEEWTGILRDKAKGKYLFKILPWLVPLQVFIEQAIQLGQEKDVHGVPVSLTNDQSYIHLSIHPFKTPEETETLLCLEDETQKKLKEAQLSRFHDWELLSSYFRYFTIPSNQKITKESNRNFIDLFAEFPQKNQPPEFHRWDEILKRTLSAQGVTPPDLQEAVVWADYETLESIVQTVLHIFNEDKVLIWEIKKASPPIFSIKLKSDVKDQDFCQLKVTSRNIFPAEDDSIFPYMPKLYALTESLGGISDIRKTQEGQLEVLIWLPTKQEKQQFQPQYKGKKVLICDDDTLVLHLISKFLNRCGFKVEEFSNGKDVLERLRSADSDIDLVILDLLLPEINGIEVFQEIKHNKPKLPVILTSGFTQGDIVEKALIDGASGFITKPFHFDTLMDRISKALP